MKTPEPVLDPIYRDSSVRRTELSTVCHARLRSQSHIILRSAIIGAEQPDVDQQLLAFEWSRLHQAFLGTPEHGLAIDCSVGIGKSTEVVLIGRCKGPTASQDGGLT